MEPILLSLIFIGGLTGLIILGVRGSVLLYVWRA
jgi:hypothetical protein